MFIFFISCARDASDRNRHCRLFSVYTVRPESVRRVGTGRRAVRDAGRHHAVPVQQLPGDRGEPESEKFRQAQETRVARRVQTRLVNIQR